MECIDFIAAMVNQYPGILAGDLQNVCKYTWRSHGKNGKEDIRKAEWYFNHAEKTWNNLMPEVQKQVQAFTRYPLFEIPNRQSIMQQGMDEVTASMGKAEKELYQRVMAGVNHFTDEYLRNRAKAALKDWSQTYEHLASKSSEIKVKDVHRLSEHSQNALEESRKIGGIHRNKKYNGLER